MHSSKFTAALLVKEEDKCNEVKLTALLLGGLGFWIFGYRVFNSGLVILEKKSKISPYF